MSKYYSPPLSFKEKKYLYHTNPPAYLLAYIHTYIHTERQTNRQTQRQIFLKDKQLLAHVLMKRPDEIKEGVRYDCSQIHYDSGLAESVGRAWIAS